MPRVHKRTRSTRPVKKPFVCSHCREEVAPGQEFYTWSKRFGGPQYRHVACGYPRPSQLSGRKTAVVEDAIQDAEEAIAGLGADGEAPEALIQDIQSTLEQVADEAESVGQEYESGADSMPESLQYGTQAEAMRAVAEELQSWADELRSFQPTSDEPDLDPEGDEQANQDILDQWADDTKSEATALMENLPEYQG
jgi:hypothetical protein